MHTQANDSIPRHQGRAPSPSSPRSSLDQGAGGRRSTRCARSRQRVLKTAVRRCSRPARPTTHSSSLPRRSRTSRQRHRHAGRRRVRAAQARARIRAAPGRKDSRDRADRLRALRGSDASAACGFFVHVSKPVNRPSSSRPWPVSPGASMIVLALTGATVVPAHPDEAIPSRRPCRWLCTPLGYRGS